MSTFNYRLAQTNGQNMSPPSTFQTISNPSNAAVGFVQSEFKPQENKQYQKFYNDTKKILVNDFITIPKNLKYNPYIYNWVIQFSNSLVNQYDNIIIWILEKGFSLTTWFKNPFLAGVIKAAEKNPEKYQIIKSVGQKIFQRLQGLNGIKNIAGFVNSGKNLRYQNALKEMPGLSRFNEKTLEQFLVNRNSLPRARQLEIAEKLNKELSLGEKIGLAKSTGTNIDDIIRLGENGSIYKQAAIKTFRGMETAMPKIAGFFEKAVPFLDTLVSIADFADWLKVWHNTGWDKMSDIEKSRLMLSALKALATICYFVPGLQPLGLLLNTVIAIVQTVGIELAENLGYTFSGGLVPTDMTKEKAEAIETISNTQIGTPPQTPLVAAFYHLIFGKLKNKVLKPFYSAVDNKKPINPRELIKSAIGGNTRTFFQNAIETEIKTLNSDIARKQYNWALNPNDTYYLELWNALSGSVKSLETYISNEIDKYNRENNPLLQNMPSQAELQKNLENKRKFLQQSNYAGMGEQGKQIFEEAVRTKADKAYNNRRYVICPSI